jgi:large subunit ribosomal protein L29
MKAEKIREIDSKDLATRLKEADEQMFRLKFQMSMGQMDGLKKYRELRKDRARMRTVLGDRARSEQKGTN